MKSDSDTNLTLVIDFETANYSASSACQLGLVVIENNLIIHKQSYFIRPPTQQFQFTHIHGITYARVKNEPTFKDHWDAGLSDWFKRAECLVAHNVGFDYKVLKATTEYYGIETPTMKRDCTVQIARKQLRISPANLAHVSQTLGIELNHHEAMSDALASAHIYLYSRTGDLRWAPRAGQT